MDKNGHQIIQLYQILVEFIVKNRNHSFHKSFMHVENLSSQYLGYLYQNISKKEHNFVVTVLVSDHVVNGYDCSNIS